MFVSSSSSSSRSFFKNGRTKQHDARKDSHNNGPFSGRLLLWSVDEESTALVSLSRAYDLTWPSLKLVIVRISHCRYNFGRDNQRRCAKSFKGPVSPYESSHSVCTREQDGGGGYGPRKLASLRERWIVPAFVTSRSR
jgi:hypothetical protein